MAKEKVVNGDSARKRPTPKPEPAQKDSAEPHSDPVRPPTRDLRPRNFDEYIGQRAVVNALDIAVQAARGRAEPIDHVLFHGPPGLGKTTLAHIIARELNSELTHTSGPALERPADVVGLLSNLKEGYVLFIDEIHRLSSAVEEYLYSAMEDFRVDFVTGSGAFAKTISLPLDRFTLAGSTTRAGMLSAPLRERFGLVYHLDYYSRTELAQVVVRSAGILGITVDLDAANEIAARARGTPRIANRLLRRVRDYAEVESGGTATLQVARDALELEGVDRVGLDRLDRLYLRTLAHNYNGGPAGIEALAATVNEEQQTLTDVVEPFLLKIGFIVRTPGGRKATQTGMEHAGAPYADDPEKSQQRLL